MANALNILHAFRSAYPSLATWLSQSSKSELIVDDSVQGCIFVPVGSVQGFYVENPAGRTFYLIQIDDRLLPQQRGGQCDGAFIYDESINLLEFKTNTTTFNKNTVRKHYNKAVNQLKNTLLRFTRAGVDVHTQAANVEAHICFNNTFPRKRASESNRAVKFALATGGVGLFFEGTKKI